jgi:hypothetical protein
MSGKHLYTVGKINPLPLAKFGCVLGAIAMLLPGIICALASIEIIATLRTFFEQAQTSGLDVLGAGVPIKFDVIKLLGLETTQALIVWLDDQYLVLSLLIVLVSVIGGGVLVALSILILGWVYNLLAALTGGLEVELRAR